MFTNRIAIVTGGGSGIGRAVCQLLAKGNASVVVADQSVKNATETISLIGSTNNNNNVQHVAVEVDVSQKDSVHAMFDQINNKYGSSAVATLVANCAGITRDGWMVDMSANDFARVIEVNLTGTFLTTQLACQRMITAKKSSGSIVNVTSVSAKIGNLGQANYVASKAAVEGFTRTVAREMGRHNIRCNAVMPGFIETPMIQTVPDKVMVNLLKQTALGRTGKPEECANAIGFLLSDDSSYVTGTILQVSGGFAV